MHDVDNNTIYPCVIPPLAKKKNKKNLINKEVTKIILPKKFD